MGVFTIGRAWALGIDFIRRSPAGHAILLILMAAVVPALIQFALIGSTSSIMSPAALSGGGGAEALVGAGIAAVLAGLAGYVLTTGGYFGSWRLGLGRDADLGRSITYGLIAGLAVVGLAFAVGLVAFLLVQLLGWAGGLLIMLLVLPLFTAFYAVTVGMIGTGMILMGILTLLFGAAISSANAAFGGLGAGMVGVAIMVPLGLLFLWLAARLCCVTPAMASRGSLNVLQGLGESWSLTGPVQVRIMLYLALVGVIFGLVYLVFAFVMAASVGMSMAGGGVPTMGIGMLIFATLLGILTAYVSVLVPAGIYRALQPDVDASAAVFE
ncbi:MAG TPA: hypothetical protein VGB79_15440 [Allosphingosinicella sp.]|jgi:hypothetical protein